MLRLFWLAFRNQLSSQIKKPIEFFSSLTMVILNNSFYLYGIYLLALLSVSGGTEATKIYLISTGMVLVSWGIVNIFGGGLYDLGKLIETGELEVFLARPRNPLLLVSISKSNLVSLGELLQGLATLALTVHLYGFPLGMRALLSSCVLTFAFAAVIILIGSLSFFSSKGSQLSHVALSVILTLSLFPVARALSGREKWILYFTPLLLTATLPRLFAETGDYSLFLVLCITTLLFFIVAVAFFTYGLKKFKSKNYIFLNE